MKIILQKIIANSGYCSRRQAEALIRTEQVKINNQLASIGDQANPDRDVITIKGHPLPSAENKIYLKLNKPLDYVCTNRKFKNEKNIFDLIKLPIRLFAVGRLDKNSRGLVLLTNDGNLTQQLTHPRFQHQKTYEVKVKGEINSLADIKNKFLGGIALDKNKKLARAKKIEYLQNKTFIITLNEGQNRQIRRMFKILNLEVTNLKRISLAGLELGTLPEGYWQYLKPEEVSDLKNQLKK